MFQKILIANRGEIACRIVDTAHRMGIATVAVYSEADANARHVAIANEAWPIGPAPAAESYLVASRIIDMAKRSGAEAIHPGYGFLSENAEFAEACAAAGLVFIGPPPGAIRAMGSKSTAKSLLENAGVPLVPGYHGAEQDIGVLSAAADRIGYPVLIKASAGGGGKGMRIVETAGLLPDALAGAKREAMASFGDDHVLIERYLTRPRHIEIQIFCDTHGHGVYLWERDCSIQRRHQKVIEEAPAPDLPPDRRHAMGEAALSAARAVGYVGAGTVEFIAEGGQFWFMEMNTRLQVEHPVTEMITGLDLVEWQLRVAAGEELPLTQDQIALKGHAIEARVYAEDPERDYLPSIGTLVHLRQPDAASDVRVDTGVRAGDVISPFYDPMIAKLIVWGPDRMAAARRLAAALEQYEVVGVATNLGLLRSIVMAPAFLAPDLDTGFINRNVPKPEHAADADATAVCAAVLSVLRTQEGSGGDPWDVHDAFVLNLKREQVIALGFGESRIPVCVTYESVRVFRLGWGGCSVAASAVSDGVCIDGTIYRATVVRHDNAITVIQRGENQTFVLDDPLAPTGARGGGDDRVAAPIPARVTHILVGVGQRVSKGTPLIVLEAMKMEITLPAPRDAVVAVIHYGVGDMVMEGAELIHFAEEE